MIPLRDRNPSRTVPFATLAIIGISTAVFLFEAMLDPRELQQFFTRFALVPGQVTYALQYGSGGPREIFGPFFTSMFLHGGWLHLIGNMWFLWIFGDNVEDTLGTLRYVVFYLLCGLAAGAAHYLLEPSSAVPTVGASGAIAGVLGGYAVLFPKARVLTLVPLGFFLQLMELPALVVLGLWFAIQALSGIFSLGWQGGGIAWWAHVGGFLAGVILVRLFAPRRPRI
jgi:membrane associated rhomboid family serine protease